MSFKDKLGILKSPKERLLPANMSAAMIDICLEDDCVPYPSTFLGEQPIWMTADEIARTTPTHEEMLADILQDPSARICLEALQIQTDRLV